MADLLVDETADPMADLSAVCSVVLLVATKAVHSGKKKAAHSVVRSADLLGILMVVRSAVQSVVR